MNFNDKSPAVDKDAFIAPSASVIGDVQVGQGSSIWYGSVLRGTPLKKSYRIDYKMIPSISMLRVKHSPCVLSSPLLKFLGFGLGSHVSAVSLFFHYRIFNYVLLKTKWTSCASILMVNEYFCMKIFH